MSTLFSHFFQKINQISPLESNFTEVLDAIAVKPKMLYFYGKMPENVVKNEKSDSSGRPKTVAIVGSRHNTKYGEEVAYKLAYELGKRGVVVVSGLAYGIDSIAHRGCLDAGGVTVAILGTRINEIYPRTHVPLAEEIVRKGGAIISEYAPASDLNAPLGPAEAGFDGEKWVSDGVSERANDAASVGTDTNVDGEISERASGKTFVKRRLDQKLSFLQRNRLISGLADIVVVVEAAEKSGTLSTAAHALAQGRDVYAVPGNISSVYSQGCNKLIRQGAIPYTEPDDLLKELFPEEFLKRHRANKRAKLYGDSDIETKILQALAKGARSGDQIADMTLLPPEILNQSLTMLEIKSRVRALGMNNWGLIA